MLTIKVWVFEETSKIANKVEQNINILLGNWLQYSLDIRKFYLNYSVSSF